MKKRTQITLNPEQWFQEADRRYPDKNYRFQCPVCKTKISYDDYVAAKAKPGQIGFVCIGRLLPKCRRAFSPLLSEHNAAPGPCDYTGGGLFRVNPIRIVFSDGTDTTVFDFADEPLMEVWPE